MYDIIGDIHGYATELKALLTKMDYQEVDGVWQHPERKVIFLGDFVDRGPEQVETVNIARSMVENGHARAVMGNHEFNAVCWATEDPDHEFDADCWDTEDPEHELNAVAGDTPNPENQKEYLRLHTDKNHRQHKEFLEQVVEGSELHKNFVEWFKTLPIFLDLPELRVVHACWSPEHLEQARGYIDKDNRLLSDSWEKASRDGSEAYDMIETLLKGLEILLPKPHFFLDKEGNPRHEIRTKWRQTENLTYHALAMVPGSEIDKIPHDPVEAHILPGYDKKKPVFVGHYWRTGEPAPLTEYVACLDYSVAGENGGKLCAYRFDGESRLRPQGFTWVDGR